MRAERTVSADHVEANSYDRWAPVYDMVFGRVFDQGRKAAVEAAEAAASRLAGPEGGRILEVGVGTGIVLPDYSGRHAVFGGDISEPMLAQARKRVAERGYSFVEGLEVMDACALDFAPASFDVVMAQYVVTTVPDPEGALDEFARVLRPGGEIVLASRLGADAGLRSSVERALMPVTRRLGWRTEFPWARYQAWLDRSPGMRLAERRAMPPLGHFSLIRFAKDAGPQQ
jgi:phosphatidylethanolamine/phosphatidyl-N-methylethanolamine N-methyltransferase